MKNKRQQGGQNPASFDKELKQQKKEWAWAGSQERKDYLKATHVPVGFLIFWKVALAIILIGFIVEYLPGVIVLWLAIVLGYKLTH